MLWPSKRRDASAAPAAAAPAPSPQFSAERFARHMAAFVDMAAEDGGPQTYLRALAQKSERVRTLAARLDARGLDLADLEDLLGLVFTARRRLYPALAALGAECVSAALARILTEERPAQERLQAFVDLLPSVASTDRESLRAAARMRRAAWDLGAEVLHHHALDRHPLMSRWVWDQNSESGALRELMAARERYSECTPSEVTNLVEVARDWAGEQLRAAGVYREIPLWIDLVLAAAYVGYLGAATQGHFGLEFARGSQRREQLRKLLGIDAGRASGRSRVRAAANGSSLNT